MTVPAQIDVVIPCLVGDCLDRSGAAQVSDSQNMHRLLAEFLSSFEIHFQKPIEDFLLRVCDWPDAQASHKNTIEIEPSLSGGEVRACFWLP